MLEAKNSRYEIGAGERLKRGDNPIEVDPAFKIGYINAI